MNNLPLLSLQEQSRYQRQMLLPEIGTLGQQKLKSSRVLVVGAGGLGCPALTYLVAAGVGSITIADGDLVDLSNLHRQTLYGDASIGRLKVEEAVQQLRRVNPTVSLRAISHNIDSSSVRSEVEKVDLVVDGSDNFATKYLLNDACVELGKPLVSGSVFCFEGQVSVFNALLEDGSRGATYRCLYPEPPPVELVPSCVEAGVLGVLPGIMGSIQAAEALKIIMGIGQPISGRLLMVDALTMTVSEISFARNYEQASKTRIRTSEYYLGLTRACQAPGGSITATELGKRLTKGEQITLIDVRELSEKEEFDLGGELIPIGNLRKQTERIPRDREVIIYCKSGMRSARAISMLQSEFGFTNLVNLTGGTDSWQYEKAGLRTLAT